MFPSGSYRFQGKVGLNEGAAGVAYCFAFGWRESLNGDHGAGQGLVIADGNEEAGFARNERFAGACSVGSDDGERGGRGFEDRDRQAFPEGAEDEGIRLGEEWLNLWLKAGEVDALVYMEAGGESAEFGLGGAGAGDGEGGFVGELSEGTQEGRVVLDGGKTANGEPAEGGDEGWSGLS